MFFLFFGNVPLTLFVWMSRLEVRGKNMTMFHLVNRLSLAMKNCNYFPILHFQRTPPPGRTPSGIEIFLRNCELLKPSVTVWRLTFYCCCSAIEDQHSLWFYDRTWLKMFTSIVRLIHRTEAQIEQEAQLSQRDRATLYASKFMLCFTRYGS